MRSRVFIPAVFALLVLLLSSCATASLSRYRSVGRIRTYHISSSDLPSAFEGFRMAFATDFHYESRFGRKRLASLASVLQMTDADVLLLGGDYRGRDGGDLMELFSELSKVKTEYGTYAVMGNHDIGGNDTLVRKAMDSFGVKLLEHEIDTIMRGKDFILVCGIRDPFDLKENGVSPTLLLNPEDFVVMITHTPDYAEDVDITNTDLVLAGHTHGGQVSLFSRWTPARFSKYGNRFISGRKENSAGIPVIISNGIGTSRRDVRLFTPSEIVVVEFHKENYE